MGQTIFAGNVLQALLAWLQSLMSGMWSLISGAGGGSLLKWLGQHWLKLLVFFLIVGIVGDKLIWLIRWRPHWAWFRKKRMIIDDDLIDEPAPRRASTRIPARKAAAVSPQNHKKPSRTPSAPDEDVDLFLDDPLFSTAGAVPVSPKTAGEKNRGLKIAPRDKAAVSLNKRTGKRTWN